MNQKGWEKSLEDGREQKGRLWCSQGAWRGPLQQVGKRASGGRHGRRAVLLKMPALPEMTDCHPTPAAIPSLPPHPPAQHTLGGQPQPEPQEGWGVEGEMQGEASSHTWAGHREEQAQSPGLSHMGAVGKAKKVPASHPQPWPRGLSSTNHITLPRPSPLPPK